MAKKTKVAAKPKVSMKMPKIISEQIASFVAPYTRSGIDKLAKVVVNTDEAITKHEADVRKSRLAGDPDPEFTKHPDYSKGQLTRSQTDKLQDSDAAQPSRYNPILVDLCRKVTPAAVLRKSKKKQKTEPKDWDAKTHGPWMHSWKEDGEVVEKPSYWMIDDPKEIRPCHSQHGEQMITDPDQNILAFGNYRYVVGDGTNVRAAFMLLSATKGGNYKAGDQIRKRMSHAGNKDITDVVFRIEDCPNLDNEYSFTLQGEFKDGIEEVNILLGQGFTAGFLFDSKGKRLTAKQIRGLDSDTKGLKFKTVEKVLGDPILGKDITELQIWEELKISDKANLKLMKERDGRSEVWESENPKKKSLYNLGVTCRVSPHEQNPHGFRAACCDMVPVERPKDDDGNKVYCHVIGYRSNIPYMGELEEVTEAPAKKVTKKSSKKSDAAPPIEGDNADEKTSDKGEIVEA